LRTSDCFRDEPARRREGGKERYLSLHLGGCTGASLSCKPDANEAVGMATNRRNLKRELPIMSVTRPKPTENDWMKTVLFDRGYLPRIRGDAIKVYLAVIEACGGIPDRSVTMSLNLLVERTQLSCPTVIESLAQLERLGLVVSTTRQRGKVKTYYISDPPALIPASTSH
jgi:hypothetical protein